MTKRVETRVDSLAASPSLTPKKPSKNSYRFSKEEATAVDILCQDSIEDLSGKKTGQDSV